MHPYVISPAPIFGSQLCLLTSCLNKMNQLRNGTWWGCCPLDCSRPQGRTLNGSQPGMPVEQLSRFTACVAHQTEHTTHPGLA